MDENDFEIYSEWAEQELVWGKGMYNWCRSYSKEEWEKQKLLCNYDELLKIEIPF